VTTASLSITACSAAGVRIGAALRIAGFLLAPSSIVDLLLNLRRELPVDTARAQLTATEAAADPAEDADESSRSL